MSVQERTHGHVDSEGRIVLPAGMRARLGLVPEAEVNLEEISHGVTLRRPATQLAKVYIEPTSRCNLTCRICIRSSWNEAQGHMDEGTFERLLDSLRRLEQKPAVVLGGFGEPLFHPRIVEMVTHLKEVAQSLELITNGMLLTDAMMDAFIRLPLNVLWFSADSLHTDANGKPSDLLPTIRKLHYARELLHRRLPETGLVFVATRSNLQEFPVLLQGAVSYGIARFMLTNLLPYSEDGCDQTLYSRTLDHMESKPSYWAPHVQLPRMDWNEDTRQALYQVLRSRPNARIHNVNLGLAAGRCPFIEAGAIAISWNGAVSPCLALMHSHVSYLYDRPHAVTRQIIGSINETSLDAIWHSSEHLAFRQRVQGFDFSPCTLCASCDMAEANLEDCYGNTFPTCGACLWAWGVIQCP